MRYLALLIVALSAAPADAQSLLPWWAAEEPRSSAIAFDWQPRATGGLPEPAGTVAHLVWQSGALVDTKGNAWAQVGTVPQVATGPWYPAGFGAAAQAGAGPFSDANYYRLGDGSAPDVLDFAGDGGGCINFKTPPALATYEVLLDNHDAGNTAGWFVYINASGNAVFASAGSADITTSNVVSLNGPNSVCFGRAGTTKLLKLNGGTLASGATTVTSATSDAAWLGRYRSAGHPSTGAIYEFVAWQGTPSDAMFTDVQRAVRAETPARGGPVTCTRASAQTCPINGVLYTVPANTCCISEAGVQPNGFQGGSNGALWARGFNASSWLKSGSAPTVTPDAAAGIDGQQLADRVDFSATTAGSNFSVVSQNLSTVSGNACFQVRVKQISGPLTLDMALSTAGPDGRQTCNLSAGQWVQCWFCYTGLVSANRYFQIGPYQITQAAQSVYLDMAQFDPGATSPGPFHDTAGATVSWPATVPNDGSTGLVDGTQWCYTTQATPGGPGAWSSGSAVWGLLNAGPYGGANSFNLSLFGTSIYSVAYDGAGALKRATCNAPAAAGSHAVTACFSGGVPTISVDGIAASGCVVDGTGTGTLTQPASADIGRRAVAEQWSGAIQRSKFCRIGAAGRCP